MLLELNNLTKRYPPAEGAEPVEVLAGLTLLIDAGESMAIVGPSGCGKSTLLNIIGTLDHPTSGTARLNGEDLSGLSEAELAGIRNRQIGYIFQSHHLLPQCTVLENVLVPTLVAGDASWRGQRVAVAQRLLERVGLGSRQSHRPGQLSGGECQRAAVVRALINSPKLLLADEPTGSLDRQSAESLVQLLVELNQEEQVTLIVVTHALQVAQQMDRVLELRDGVLVRSDQ